MRTFLMGLAVVLLGVSACSRQKAPAAGSGSGSDDKTTATVVDAAPPLAETRTFQPIARFTGLEATGFAMVQGHPVLERCHAFRHLAADLQEPPATSDGGDGDGGADPRDVLLAPKWPFDCSIPFGVDHERVVTFSHGDVQLRSFDAASGNMAWLAYVPDDAPELANTPGNPLPPQLDSVPLLVGDRVVFVAGMRKPPYRTLVAFKARTGEVAWQQPGKEVVVTDGTSLYASDGHMLSALDPESRTARWSVETTIRPQAGNPTFLDFSDGGDGNIAAGGGRIALVDSGTAVLLDAADGHTLATIPHVEAKDAGAGPSGRIFDRVTFTGGAFYVFGNAGLARIDPRTAHVDWVAPGVFERPVGSERALFVPTRNAQEHSSDGIIAGLDPGSGQTVWSYSLSPAVGGAIHFSRDARGAPLLALGDVGSGELVLFRPSAHGEPLAPRTKTLDLTIADVSDKERIFMRVGDRLLHLPPDGHWRGEVTGRGRLAVESTDGFPDSLEPSLVDMEDGQPETKLVLEAFVVNQACKVD
jgi:outer membrane protein assembly factor BamB